MGELRCTLKQAQDGVAVPLDESTTIIVVPAVAQVTLQGRAFDSGRTFLLPRAVNALNDVFAFATRMQAKHAVVVGHVDDVDPEPDVLSEARAKVAAAWLAGDPGPWVAQYADNVPEARRWGAREDRYLLGMTLGGVTTPPPNEAGSGDPQVRAFQTLAGIKVDGIAGPVTRRKLVERYFALSRAALLNGTKPPDNGITLLDTQIVSHPAAANFTLQQVAEAKGSTQPGTESEGSAPTKNAALPENATASKDATDTSATGESEPNARIDFMFFFADSGPDPAPGAPDGPQYLEWVAQTELQRAMVVGPGTGGSKIFLELWDKAEVSRHKGAKYTIAGAETFTGFTNSQGRVEHDDVPPGDYTLTLTLEFFEGADKLTDEYTCPVVVQNGEKPPQVRLLGAVPRCELAQLRGLLFETNKAFLVPEAIAALKDIRQIYERHSGSELLVVGHTDTTGTPDINDPLSFERAKATLAYLQDDVDTWLTFYQTNMPAARRWGEPEDARMQELVGDPSLERPALIAAYMALDGAELDAAEFQLTGVAHGCGENFPLNDCGEELDDAAADGKEDALDRRVELFFFDPEFGVVPKPKGELSKKGSKQYPAWRKLAKVVREEEVVGPSVYEVFVQFVDSAEAHLGPITYRIETVEGMVLEGSDSQSTVKATLRTSGKQALLIVDGREITLEL